MNCAENCIESGRERERAKLSIHKQCHIPDVYFVSITTETDRVEVANFLPGKQGISESL